jgi:hypothetical protein
MRFIPNFHPCRGPKRSIASYVYTEQVGVKRHIGPNPRFLAQDLSGETYF